MPSYDMPTKGGIKRFCANWSRAADFVEAAYLDDWRITSLEWKRSDQQDESRRQYLGLIIQAERLGRATPTAAHLKPWSKRAADN